ncbi:hypothetical protein B0I35DRAFT_474831 [Stachybotrys elegans]|uniref:Uncharacterized protein n=1 Tax=Stachybotrys elegans TaxID=80388 RepID=A0A8K0WUY4_9HYPO|nr:hypothetical protein B0I35DRAFT_474831 [Stachybotrys elegans]
MAPPSAEFEARIRLARSSRRLLMIGNIPYRESPERFEAACRTQMNSPADAQFSWEPADAPNRSHRGRVWIAFESRERASAALQLLRPEAQVLDQRAGHGNAPDALPPTAAAAHAAAAAAAYAAAAAILDSRADMAPNEIQAILATIHVRMSAIMGVDPAPPFLPPPVAAAAAAARPPPAAAANAAAADPAGEIRWFYDTNRRR